MAAQKPPHSMSEDPQLLLSSHFRNGEALYSAGSLHLFSHYSVFFSVEVSKSSSRKDVRLLLYAVIAREE